MRHAVLYILILISTSIYSQYKSVNGFGAAFTNQSIVLKGNNIFGEVTLGSTTADNLGKFTLNFDSKYRGAAILKFDNTDKIILLINNENINISWTDEVDFKTLHIDSSENDVFANGMEIYQNAASKLVGLEYLEPLYKNDPVKNHFFKTEIDTISLEYNRFTDRINNKMYAQKYLKWRGFISDMPQTAQKYKDRFPAHDAYFRTINFADQDLLSSGLLKDLIEGYTQLCESLGEKEGSKHLISGIAHVMNDLTQKQEILIIVSDFWFRYLEQRNNTSAAAFLATYMLENDKCVISQKQIDRYEQYRKMDIGNTAPNINLPGKESLSKLNNDYKLVVFGASWCPLCQEEYPLLIEKYKALKESYNVEIIYISLDKDKKAYSDFFKDSPFITVYSGKEWETKIVKDYHVFATPTLFLLDKNLKIMQKPANIAQAEAWLGNRG